MGSCRRTGLGWKASLLAISLACGICGCSFGPVALVSTHGRYGESVKQVQDEELLRNIVRLRYNDSLSLLEVSSIASQYELAAGAEARPFFVAPNPGSHPFRTFGNVLPDLTASTSNRPTITLIPNDDPDTIRRLLTPATAESIVFFAQTGWPVATISRLWFDSINGVPNASSALGGGLARTCPPDFGRFRRVAELLQSLQISNAGSVVSLVDYKPIGRPIASERLTAESQVEAAGKDLEYRRGDDAGTSVLTRAHRNLILKINPQAIDNLGLRELCDLLGLQPGLTSYVITAGELPPYPAGLPSRPLEQIDFIPRSPIQVLFYMSHGVVVPAEHVAEGVVHSTPGPDGRAFDWTAVTDGLFRVCHARQHHRPDCAYVAVKYRDYWFYIDDRDHASKMAFNLMVPLMKLDLGTASKRARQSAPILTLPVGN